MIIPINVATRGNLYQGISPLSISVDGYLTIPREDIPDQPQPPIINQGGGTLTYKEYKRRLEKEYKDKFILLEDEEIELIIKTFLKCQ